MSTSIANVTALKKVVAARQTAPLEDVVHAINITLELSVTADRKARSLRLDAGRMLVELRRRVQEGGDDWWAWEAGRFARSRKDVEKLMRMASADDPEAEARREKSERNERRKRQQVSDGAARRSKPEPRTPSASEILQRTKPSHILGAVSYLAALCEKHDPVQVAFTVSPREVEQLKANVDLIDRWLDRFAIQISAVTIENAN